MQADAEFTCTCGLAYHSACAMLVSDCLRCRSALKLVTRDFAWLPKQALFRDGEETERAGFVCYRCGGAVYAEDVACPHCSLSLQAVQAIRCPACGCPLDDGVCSWCGTPYGSTGELYVCSLCGRVGERIPCRYCGSV